MNWHETILHIRNNPEWVDLIDKAYFDPDLPLNVERFRSREEYKAVLDKLFKLGIKKGRLLDIGSGNGISAISFALDGFTVSALEPDPSDTIGAGAIRKLVDHYKLHNVEVVEAFAEDMPFPTEFFDLIFVRQALHHANDLDQFLKECARVLKKGGILFTVRDHVVFNEADKQRFLESHPLHKFYGGENAFKPEEYRAAMRSAGFEILDELKHFESPINYYPIAEEEVINAPLNYKKQMVNRLKSKIGFLAGVPFIKNWYFRRNGFSINGYWDERKVPGRLYSYVCRKV